jgi:hypothetical protein
MFHHIRCRWYCLFPPTLLTSCAPDHNLRFGLSLGPPTAVQPDEFHYSLACRQRGQPVILLW